MFGAGGATATDDLRPGAEPVGCGPGRCATVRQARLSLRSLEVGAVGPLLHPPSRQRDRVTVRAAAAVPVQYSAASRSAASAFRFCSRVRTDRPVESLGPNRARRTVAENDSPGRFAAFSVSYASSSSEIVLVAMHETIHEPSPEVQFPVRVLAAGRTFRTGQVTPDRMSACGTRLAGSTAATAASSSAPGRRAASRRTLLPRRGRPGARSGRWRPPGR